MSLVDIQKRIARKEEKYFKDPVKYARKIKQIASSLLDDPDVKVILFGSAARGEAIPGKSDIDILIVSTKIPKRASEQAKIRVKILEEIGDLAAPFEIHLATPQLYQKWYKKHIDVEIPV